MKSLSLRVRFALLLLVVMLGTWISSLAQITPSQDSYTNTATASTNYGASATLGVVSSATSIQTTYIQFDLSSVPSGYASSNVAKATLKLYVNAVAKAGSFNIDLVNGSWSEKTITAGLSPALGTTIASSVPLTTANVNDYVLIDVTSAVDEWLNGSQPNDGIALVANSPLSTSFDSKENTTQSHPAELDIVFTSGGTLTGVTTAAGSGLTGGGTSGTLNLSLQKNCANKQILQWNGSAWVCATAGTGTISGITAGTDLTGGGVGGNVTLNLDTTKVPQLNANNTFSGSQSVNNQVLIIDSVGSEALGVSANGPPVGIVGFTNSTAGVGIVGFDTANTGTGIGVEGVTDSLNGIGVSGSGGVGVQGTATMFLSNGAGGNFTGYSALANSGNNGTTGVVATGGNGDPASIVVGGFGLVATGGTSFSDGGLGVLATGGNAGSNPTSGGGTGVFATGGNGPSGGGEGVVGNGGTGGAVDGVGGQFTGGNNGGTNGGTGDGMDAMAGSGFAASFEGDIFVAGAISADIKDFKIDHPMDPANKYLVHASVESSEMMNIYTGNVILDAYGAATVQLPKWFEVLNTDFRYQLTAIGTPGPGLYIAHKIANGNFEIAGGAPNAEVSWQVTGVRQDAYAKAHPLVVEEEKDARLKGFYKHPKLYGAPDEKQIEWARHPQMMKQMKEHQQKVARPVMATLAKTAPAK
jgi:trimeric autotransporter adhesin